MLQLLVLSYLQERLKRLLISFLELIEMLFLKFIIRGTQNIKFEFKIKCKMLVPLA